MTHKLSLTKQYQSKSKLQECNHSQIFPESSPMSACAGQLRTSHRPATSSVLAITADRRNLIIDIAPHSLFSSVIISVAVTSCEGRRKPRLTFPPHDTLRKCSTTVSMPIQKRVEVRVQCNGQSLQEYPVPVSEAAPDNEYVCYIEATAGERFDVLIRYLPGYRVDRAKSLVAELSLDGLEIMAPPKLSKNLVTWNGALVDSVEHLCSNYSANITKHLSKTFYHSFGALEISMSKSSLLMQAKFTDDLKLRQLKKRSSIIRSCWTIWAKSKSESIEVAL